LWKERGLIDILWYDVAAFVQATMPRFWMPPHVLAFSTVDAVSAMVTFEQGTAPAQLEKGWRRLPGCRCINFSSGMLA